MSGTRLAGAGLRELRLHLCQKSPASAGARGWVEADYVPLKKANPRFPILVRECDGIQPRLWARFAKGREASVSLENKTAQDVSAAIQQFAHQA